MRLDRYCNSRDQKNHANQQIRLEKSRKIEESSSAFVKVDDQAKQELLKTLIDTI